MIRPPLTLLALAVLASCSLTEGSGGPSQVWSAAIPDADGFAGPASADDAHVYVIRGRALHAFDVETGDVAWRAPVSNVCTPAPVAAGRVFCPSDRLHAFDAQTGAPLWTATPDSTLLFVTAAADAQRVYVGTLSSIAAYDAASGALVWQRSLKAPEWTGTRNRALALDGSTLFATTEAGYSDNGYLSASAVVALDAATGRERWRFVDGDGSDSQKIGGLAVTDDVLIYSDPENGQQVVAVDRATRAVRWRVPRRPGFLGTLEAPAVVEGVAYLAEGDERLYAIDVATGDVRWSVMPDRGSYRGHAVCGSYLVGDNTALTVVDRSDGSRVDVLFGGSGENVLQLATRGRRLFVATTAGVYAYDC